MSSLDSHPTVRKHRALPLVPTKSTIDAAWVRKLCLDAGADDVGFVRLDRRELDAQRGDILKVFPKTRSLVSIVCRLNRSPIRSVARSAANLEFHQTADRVNQVTSEIVRRLEQKGVDALNCSAGFPMEMASFPGKVWFVSHKPVAEAAGLGKMGVHRNVIHPKFGSFILLGTVLVDREISDESQPIDFNPCLGCKLCVSACPVGAIKSDGRFDPGACMNHNYREFMSGFTDWIETVIDSQSRFDYRRKVTDSETASMWQSLSFSANYKAAYCMAVCPAGEDVIAPFLSDRAQFVATTVEPLQQKVEPVYVIRNSDAHEHVEKRFPNKLLRIVNGVRPASIQGFFEGLPVVFQSGKAIGLDAVFHFRLTGSQAHQATVTIRDQRVRVETGLQGQPDCEISADSAVWLAVVRNERSVVWSILTRRIRVRGGLKLLKAFSRCFPS